MSDSYKEPESDYDALVLALTLAIEAPSNEKKQECVDMAEVIALHLTELDVVRAKRQVKQILNLR
jgi:hypothetical protein